MSGSKLLAKVSGNQPITLTGIKSTTVVPTKSDSDIMFCLQRIRDVESIDHLCINPIHRIG